MAWPGTPPVRSNVSWARLMTARQRRHADIPRKQAQRRVLARVAHQEKNLNVVNFVGDAELKRLDRVLELNCLALGVIPGGSSVQIKSRLHVTHNHFHKFRVLRFRASK